MNKSFFAGMEEVFSRLISVFLTVVFFLVYVFAKDSQELFLEWSGVFFVLFIFWVIYESLSYGLYILFVYFTKQGREKTITKLHDNEAEGTSSNQTND